MHRLVNKSNKEVLIQINNENNERLMPNGQKICHNIMSEDLHLTLSHTKGSYKKNNMAHINIETRYIISDFEDNVELIVTREKMKIDEDMFYDCFLLNLNGENIEPIGYQVVGEDELRKKMIHKGILGVFVSALESMLGDMIVFLFATIFIGFLTVFFWGWKWLLIGIACIFLIYVIGELFSNIVMHMFGKKVSETVEQRLNRVITKEHISSFFSNPNRSAYDGKIER